MLRANQRRSAAAEQVKHVVGFSGGIDSQACARWVLNRYPAEDVILLNSDAGGNEHPIHFTNLIHDGQLYTYTYKWPGIPELPCSHVGAFTLEQLNAGLAQAAFAGRETLHRESDYEVNHFRSVSVIDLPSGAIEGIGEDVPVRIPLMAGDIYVDADDPSMLRQLLHFGLQNLYDPNLDEWILIDEHSDEPGEVILPRSCARQR